MLYNTSSSRYRSFNRIYPSIIARKYRYRNTFQRYSDTTVPHFTFFHQHPSRQKSQTSALVFSQVLPSPVPQPLGFGPMPQIPTPTFSLHHQVKNRLLLRCDFPTPDFRISRFPSSIDSAQNPRHHTIPQLRMRTVIVL